MAITPDQVGGCRLDPVLNLSDGKALHITDDVACSASQVTAVDYEVHLPVGVTVVSVTKDPAPLGDLEVVHVFNDHTSDYVSTTSTVSTAGGNYSDANTLSLVGGTSHVQNGQTNVAINNKLSGV